MTSLAKPFAKVEIKRKKQNMQEPIWFGASNLHPINETHKYAFMGLFNLSKKQTQNYTNFKAVMVDDAYYIKIPSDWHPFESDRFRARSQNKKVELSISNFVKPNGPSKKLSIEDLKDQYLPLFERFVREGDYLPNYDLEMGEDFIYQSFKVGRETQYYHYTSRVIANKCILIGLIIRQRGKREPRHVALIKEIVRSISPRIA